MVRILHNYHAWDNDLTLLEKILAHRNGEIEIDQTDSCTVGFIAERQPYDIVIIRLNGEPPDRLSGLVERCRRQGALVLAESCDYPEQAAEVRRCFDGYVPLLSAGGLAAALRAYDDRARGYRSSRFDGRMV